MAWIDSARTVARERQWRWIDAESGHLCSSKCRRRTMLDGATACMLVQVHDALHPENQAKFAALPLLKAVAVGWKLVGPAR